MVKSRKNPLIRRIPRELRTDFGKYLVIFILMIASIGLVSGYLVAAESMIQAYDQSFEKYHIEDGNFHLSEKATRGQVRDMEDHGVRIYENFYREMSLENGSTMRFFKNRTEINLACVMDGRLPEKPGETAIDRMYADNNHLKVGDKISGKNHSFTITGLIALSDYSALFQDNNDTMFDSILFGVGLVSEEEFNSWKKDSLRFCYSWIYNDPPADEEEEKELSDDLMEDINDIVSLESFTPRYTNQAIIFTGDDMGHDRAMMQVLLYIIIVIIAFVFRITINDTIQKESAVIGTLRASGYTRWELVRHYMAAPVAVTLISALIGNILGYTFLKDFCAGLYYSSYSLPTYVTLWNGSAFFQTTVIPILIMMLITFLSLRKKLSLPPLAFLRRDLTRGKGRKAMRLPHILPFFTRFRLRVILQNKSNYIMLFFGIIFANFLLIFGLALPSVLDHYQENIGENMLSRYQYILQIPMSAMNEDRKLESLFSMMVFYMDVETDVEDAEKFTAYPLQTLGDGLYKKEEVTFYGIDKKSAYIPLDVKDGQVWISSAYAEKYGIKKGDKIKLKEKYESKYYDFTVNGIYDYEGGLCVFMEQKLLNQTLDLESDYFSGYLSDQEIKDIDKKYISTVIDYDSLTKISRQLQRSMGSMMYLVDAFSILIFIVLIYLMSKIIIEKNAQSISMTKILGYNNKEISRLYITSTTVVVILFLLISMPLESILLEFIFKVFVMTSISGWIPYWLDPWIYVKIFVLGLATYLVVAFLEYKKIQGIPLDTVLKNRE